MEIIHVNGQNIGQCATRAAKVLRAGGVIVYPTDTLYGLGAAALSDEAVAKVRAIKGRDKGKPMHALVSGAAMAGMYGEVTKKAETLAKEFGGGVTVVVKKRSGFDAGILRGVPTFGFRIPDSDFCSRLLTALCGPVTATSASRSGLPAMRRISDILAQFGDHAEKIDLVIDGGTLPAREPSTVVDLSLPKPKIWREGAILASNISAILR